MEPLATPVISCDTRHSTGKDPLPNIDPLPSLVAPGVLNKTGCVGSSSTTL